MLFVNDSYGQTLVPDLLLKNRVGSDQDIDRPIHQSHQCRLANLALVAPGQYCDVHR
jgi:hypothetical protein